MGDLRSLCGICGKEWADRVCNNCLISVCQKCFNDKKDMCLLCAQGPQFKK